MVNLNVSGRIKDVVFFLNKPCVKESLKEVFGVVTFANGLFELGRDIKAGINLLRGRIQKQPLEEEQDPTETKHWSDIAYTVMEVVTRASLITSAIVSRPGLRISRRIATHLFTDEQLLRYFGPNLNFASTPYHPRHVLSILSFVAGIPATLKTMGRVIKSLESGEKADVAVHDWMATWNTLTSRPMIHFANYVCHLIV